MRVEGRDLVDLGLRHLHFVRERGEMRGGEMTVLVLDEMQMLDQQIAPSRPIGEQRLHVLERLRKEGRFALYRGAAALVHYIALDSTRDVSPFVTAKDGKPLANNPLKDPRVRKALSLAINRDALVKRVMEGSGIPAGQLLSSDFPGSSKAIKPDPFDAARAQALLNLKKFRWEQIPYVPPTGPESPNLLGTINDVTAMCARLRAASDMDARRPGSRTRLCRASANSTGACGEIRMPV